MKKCLEISVLTECDIALMVIHRNRLYQYASSDMDQLLLRYTDSTREPQESRTNADVSNNLLSYFNISSIYHEWL